MKEPSMLKTSRSQFSREDSGPQISSYVSTALAAGVSLMALAQSAQSEVIVTKKTISISPFSSVLLDLNKDGIADFKLSFTGSNYGHTVSNYINVVPLTGGEVVGSAAGKFGPYASALVRGANVGASAHFVGGMNGKVMLEHFLGIESGSLLSYTYGKWDNLGPNRFLGVKFPIHGQMHYGWIRITVNVAKVDGVSGTITAYAYETIPNKKITVGSSTDTTSDTATKAAVDAKPSLGMLALGAPGLDIWRRTERVTIWAST
jgi:hypothetical protein